MGWSSHPDGREPPPRPPEQVPDGRVVGLGAICDRAPLSLGQNAGSQNFTVSEFVKLEDGRCVILHQERGWTQSALLGRDTTERVIESVLNTVLPDDDEEALRAPHPWQWLAELAQARGLTVTAAELEQLDYEVVLSDAVRRWIAGDA